MPEGSSITSDGAVSVEFAGVSVAIGSTPVVHGVDLRIEPGSFAGVIGPNGSGKSTLLRTLYKATAPRAGVVWVDGKSLASISSGENAKSVAALTQDSPVDFDFTAREVIETGRLPHRSTPSEDAAVVSLAASVAGVEAILDRSVLGISGGERQRVLIARALAQQPRLLVLDEPTNHLDIAHQYEILRAIKELGITVFAALHDMNLAAEFCDRLHVMNSGQMVLSGTAHEVLTDAHLRAYFGIGGHIVPHPVTGTPHVIFTPPPRPPRYFDASASPSEEKQ